MALDLSQFKKWDDLVNAWDSSSDWIPASQGGAIGPNSPRTWQLNPAGGLGYGEDQSAYRKFISGLGSVMPSYTETPNIYTKVSERKLDGYAVPKMGDPNFSYWLTPDQNGGIKVEEKEVPKDNWFDKLVPILAGSAIAGGALGAFGGLGSASGAAGAGAGEAALGSGLSLGSGGVTGITGGLDAGLGFAGSGGLGLTTAGASSGALGSLAPGFFAAETLGGLGALSGATGALGGAAEAPSGWVSAEGGAGYLNGAAADASALGGAESGGVLSKLVSAAKADPRLIMNGVGVLQSLLKDDKAGQGGTVGMAGGSSGGSWTPTQQQWANDYFNKLPSREVNPYQGDLSQAPIVGGEHMWFK